MMLGVFGRLGRDDRGAVAPIAAISLVGLIAAGGLAVDYARLAALDTELQQAADLAALAAATQLDRGDDSQARATAAITDPNNAERLAANLTKFANDTEGLVVEVPTIAFCENFDDTEPDNDIACEDAAAGDGAATRYVMVTTEIRTANYALTPVVAAFSGTLTATAVASVESSICNVSPLLVCLPSDDLDFPSSDDIGRGIVLKPFSPGDAWAPGNYGLLDFGAGNQAVLAALLGHGLNGCQSQDDGSTEPGVKEVTDAINTRMDVYEGNNPLTCDPSDGTGCPAPNSGKDMVIALDDATIAKSGAGASTMPTQTEAEAVAGTCPVSPTLSNFVKFVAPTSPVVGFGRDACHYSESCTGGNYGDGVWDAAAYFDRYHGGDASDALDFVGKDDIADLTRYDVYQWENDDPANMPATKRYVSVDPTPKITGGGSNYAWTVKTQCAYSEPVFGSTAYPEQKDRRILPIVAADCTNLQGKGQAFEDYVILRVFDIFLTEPSEDRAYPGPTEHKEIYGEVIGPALTAQGGGSYQYYSRNKPFLVR